MLRIIVAAAVVITAVSGAAIAGGDAKRGEQVFGRCAMCHSAERGGGNGLGPNLSGIVGHKAASVPGFYYSSALKSANITWTDAKLHDWLVNPQKAVPGTRMVFAGLKKQQEIDDVIAYLRTKK